MSRNTLSQEKVPAGLRRWAPAKISASRVWAIWRRNGENQASCRFCGVCPLAEDVVGTLVVVAVAQLNWANAYVTPGWPTVTSNMPTSGSKAAHVRYFGLRIQWGNPCRFKSCISHYMPLKDLRRFTASHFLLMQCLPYANRMHILQ